MNRVLKNRYEVQSVLGRGGMGCVYKVADRQQRGAIRAAKELQAGGIPDERKAESLVQFQTEARILARLTHPNLPKVFDYFSLGGKYYIIMEYVQGKTLEQILTARQGKPIEERVVLSWALQISRAMHFLSVQKPQPIVFRDLKPSNIMIDRSGRVKLIDFGIARFFKEDKSEDTYVYGTPGYAAPEQYGTGQTDVRSDIFSLGATMHHCLTGKNPSDNPLDFDDPHKLNRRISRAAAGIVMRALAQDREKRFRSALEMKQAVQRALFESAGKPRGGGQVIEARAGKPITLPPFRKTCWVSVPVTALGCSGQTGVLSTDDLWIQPRPRAFGPDAARLLFRVESGMLKPGRDYRPHITITTDGGMFKPVLLFRKSWPWVVAQAAALLGLLAYGMHLFGRW